MRNTKRLKKILVNLGNHDSIVSSLTGFGAAPGYKRLLGTFECHILYAKVLLKILEKSISGGLIP